MSQLRLTKRDISRHRRDVFEAVINTYNHCRSISGTPQAMDYSKAQSSGGGSPGGGSDASKAYPLSDFTIDVYNAVKSCLTPEQLRFFHNSLEDKSIDIPVQPEWYIAIQEKLGRVFLSRGLYPLNAYFSDCRGIKFTPRKSSDDEETRPALIAPHRPSAPSKDTKPPETTVAA